MVRSISTVTVTGCDAEEYVSPSVSDDDENQSQIFEFPCLSSINHMQLHTINARSLQDAAAGSSVDKTGTEEDVADDCEAGTDSSVEESEARDGDTAKNILIYIKDSSRKSKNRKFPCFFCN